MSEITNYGSGNIINSKSKKTKIKQENNFFDEIQSNNLSNELLKELDKIKEELDKHSSENSEEICIIDDTIKKINDKDINGLEKLKKKFTMGMLEVAKELSLDLLIRFIHGEINIRL